MTFRSVLRLLPLIAAAALSSCASQATGFTKVKIYRLNPSARISSVDPSVTFEQQHHLYGAVSNVDREARRGNYYTFFWNAQDTKQPAQIRFEYLQSATGFKKKQKTVVIDKVRRSNITQIQVTGEEYHMDGKVLAWRATLIQNGQEIGSRQSSLWQ